MARPMRGGALDLMMDGGSFLNDDPLDHLRTCFIHGTATNRLPAIAKIESGVLLDHPLREEVI